MGAKAFNDWWSSTLGDVPPLGWVLRERFAPRWVRFHTLPDAKRYADTEQERAEVVHRQVCVAAAVLGDNRPAWFIVPSYEAGGQQSMRLDEAPGLALTRVGDLVVDDDAHTFWAVLVPWEPQVFEPALRAIADDRLRRSGRRRMVRSSRPTMGASTSSPDRPEDGPSWRFSSHPGALGIRSACKRLRAGSR